MQALHSRGNTAPVGEDCLYLNVGTPVVFLAKPGVTHIADARKLSAETIQSATGGGMAFRPAANGFRSRQPLWPAFTDENQQVMVFDGSSGARTYPLLEKAKMLDTYFDEGSDHGGHH
jgi:carboxylesterase type B